MRYRILRLPDIRVSMGGDISVQCIGRFAILKATTGKVTEMNAIDTKQRILDAVDANFDAQLATTRDFVAIPCGNAATRSTIGISMSTISGICAASARSSTIFPKRVRWSALTGLHATP